MKLIIASSLTEAVRKNNPRYWEHMTEAKAYARQMSLSEVNERCVIVQILRFVETDSARAEYKVLARFKAGQELK